MAVAANLMSGVPPFESPFFAHPVYGPSIRPENLKVAQDLARDGFALIDFPDPDLDRRAEAIKRALHDRYDWSTWRASGHAKSHSLKLQDAWAFSEDVHAIACNAAVLDLLSDLYGRPAQPFQTLNLPVGTQQAVHSDAAHFSCVPERFMCGVWVALEDIDEDAGPLVYYPGTHKWPVLRNEHLDTTAFAKANIPRYTELWDQLLSAQEMEPRRFLARKGQALIWAANLLHGGDRQTNIDRTRWSQVTHYYFEGCSYFTPFLSDPFCGSIAWRKPTDIRTGAAMVNRLGAREVDPAFIDETVARAGHMVAGTPLGLSSELQVARAEAEFHRRRADRVTRSLSWRLTAPLRGLGKLFERSPTASRVPEPS